MPFYKSENMSKLRLSLNFGSSLAVEIYTMWDTEPLTLGEISRKLCIVLYRKIITVAAADNCPGDLVLNLIPIDSALMLRNIYHEFSVLHICLYSLFAVIILRSDNCDYAAVVASHFENIAAVCVIVGSRVALDCFVCAVSVARNDKTLPH